MELSNAVTVLIARMESHPDDFERWGRRAKFADTADALDGLAGLNDEIKAPFWFLNDTDKQALLEAWKQVHYTKWEKSTLERVFDEGYYERMDAIETQKRQYEQQMYQQRMAMQNAIHPLHNNAQQGLISSVGTTGHTGGLLGGLTGIFK